jgi:hypothetical protein
MPKTDLMGLPAKMIDAYLTQTEQYYSETKDAFIRVADMHPTYAGNAAARYMREAHRWAIEAGADDVVRVQVWMIRRPLFLALVARANVV